LSPPVASPCVNVCQVDPRSGLCLGCLRTIDEIAGWLDYSDAEKQRVLERLEERRRASRKPERN
jgi:predicted Fe-S protein YdhL (DUF1289 family)